MHQAQAQSRQNVEAAGLLDHLETSFQRLHMYTAVCCLLAAV
jgi:hypothetical protein